MTVGLEKLFKLASDGFAVDPWSSNSLEQWVQHLGFTPPRTQKDNPSVSNDWLMAQGHDQLKMMAEYRQGEKIRRDFIEGLVMAQSHSGRGFKAQGERGVYL